MSEADAGGARAPALARSWILSGDAPVALAEADHEGRLWRANARFCALVGREESELVGVALRRLLHDDDHVGHERELRALVDGEVGYRRDERYVRSDGAVVWATNEIERATDASGRLSLLVVAHASAALLARAERGRERAEAEGRRRDEFLNVLSHELRSPLAAILVWARLLRESGHEGLDAERGLEVIERSGRALERILDDLVHVARISSGKPELASRTALDLRTVATAAADAMRGEADAKGVKLSRVLPADPVTVSGDPGLLQQAIARLLSNALKFTPPDGSVELSLDSSGVAALIRVADTGEGMSEAFLPLAFERFRQDAAQTRAHRGLGLGLYIVRHLVTQHGGRVSASSPGRGKGSVFTIRLPLAAPAVPDAATQDLPPELAQIRPGLRVLIVDDDDDTREALRLILKQNGIAVETASSAAEALEKLQAAKPDVVLSDIAMPVEDGVAFIRRVRALPAEEGGAVPAAALTAYAGPSERDAALRAGFDRHLPKPVDPPELLRVIAELSLRRA